METESEGIDSISQACSPAALGFTFTRSSMSTRMEEHTSEVLTEQEAAVYDRQIRVWGVDAQRRYEIIASTFLSGSFPAWSLTCEIKATTSNQVFFG